jgi:hypothetical protein
MAKASLNGRINGTLQIKSLPGVRLSPSLFTDTIDILASVKSLQTSRYQLLLEFQLASFNTNDLNYAENLRRRSSVELIAAKIRLAFMRHSDLKDVSRQHTNHSAVND